LFTLRAESNSPFLENILSNTFVRSGHTLNYDTPNPLPWVVNKANDLAQPTPRTHKQHFPCFSVSIQLINGDIPPKSGAAIQAVSWRYLRNMQL
jgi:hypothetical protein